METKEFNYSGMCLNGIIMLVLNLLCFFGGIALVITAISMEEWELACSITSGIAGGLLILLSLIMAGGFILVEPGEARVLMFFGKYKGTFTKAGFYWIHPFINQKKLSLRARNLDGKSIKVNDKTGNPVMIGMVLVWKLKDTYKAMFEIDSQTMASQQTQGIATAAGIMNAFELFVSIQADAALRQVAGQYAYDNENNNTQELTLRDGSDEINKQLEAHIDERLAMAGIEVIEARINYLAYAPEIAAVMLRRQQATAIIAAR